MGMNVEGFSTHILTCSQSVGSLTSTQKKNYNFQLLLNKRKRLMEVLYKLNLPINVHK